MPEEKRSTGPTGPMGPTGALGPTGSVGATGATGAEPPQRTRIRELLEEASTFNPADPAPLQLIATAMVLELQLLEETVGKAATSIASQVWELQEELRRAERSKKQRRWRHR